VPNTNYKVLIPQIIITMPSYIQYPLCGGLVVYKITANGVALKPFMQFDTSTTPPTLKVQTNSNLDIN
jgi:hypothetical protein